MAQKNYIPRQSIQYAKKSVIDWLIGKEGRLCLHIHGNIQGFRWRKTILNRILDKHTRMWKSFYFRLGLCKFCIPRVWLQNVRWLPWFIFTHRCSDSSVRLWRFWKVCCATYGLDHVHFYTALKFSGEAFFKICNAKIELLSNRELLEMAENLIRGGNFSLFEKRSFEANINYLPTHDP